MAMTATELGRKVKAARALRGLKQLDLAQILGVSQNRVSLIERGLSSLTALELKRLVEETGLPISFFLGDEWGDAVGAVEPGPVPPRTPTGQRKPMPAVGFQPERTTERLSEDYGRSAPEAA